MLRSRQNIREKSAAGLLKAERNKTAASAPIRIRHPFPEFEPHFLTCRQTLASPATATSDQPTILASKPGKCACACKRTLTER
jgi:hypothetical protein